MDEKTAPGGAPRRFVPASQFDFSRYAKDLAWLLEIKLQPAQELLSRIYGYEHLHELQQALKHACEPGPYWDDGTQDEDDGAAKLKLLCGLPGERPMRPLDIFLDWKIKRGGKSWLEKNEAFIVEIGLTDSPTSHRDCMRRVKAFLEQEYTVDSHGYPTGFWSFFAGYKLNRESEQIATSVEQLLGPTAERELWRRDDPMQPFDQLLCVVRSRAVDVLKALGAEIEHEYVVDWDFGFGEVDDGWLSMWELVANSGEWGESWEVECANHVFELGDEGIDAEQLDAMCAFVRWPSESTLRPCKSEKGLDEAVSRVGRWRLGWLLSAADQWVNAQPRVISLQGVSLHKEESTWVRDPGHVNMVMRRRRQFDYEENISLLDVVATMTIEGESGKDEIVGVAQGWHFAPVAETYADFDTVDEFMRWEGDELLAEGWKVLMRYMSIRGIIDMNDWVNSEEGCAMTLVKLTMVEKFATDEYRARLIQLLVECFDEQGGPDTSSVDQYGMFDHIPGLEVMYMSIDDLSIRTPGLIVVSIKGFAGVGMSIAEEDGESRQILVTGLDGGANSSRGRRALYSRSRLSEEQKASRAHARRLLEAVGDGAIDVAVLDLEAGDRAGDDHGDGVDR